MTNKKVLTDRRTILKSVGVSIPAYEAVEMKKANNNSTEPGSGEISIINQLDKPVNIDLSLVSADSGKTVNQENLSLQSRGPDKLPERFSVTVQTSDNLIMDIKSNDNNERKRINTTQAGLPEYKEINVHIMAENEIVTNILKD